MKKTKVIIIIGTPGVGKSTLAIFLQKKFGWRRLDLHQYYSQLSCGYNRKKQCYDLSLPKLKKLVLAVRDELACRKIGRLNHSGKDSCSKDNTPLIIDSHVAHHLPAEMVDLCVVLTQSNLQKLKKRLEQRGYGRNKVQENLEAEIMQVCLAEAQEQGHKILVCDNLTRKKMGLLSMRIAKSIK